ncbi:hypothetical protein GALMADRAFT_1163021 [Galerina marginata CBS 339.88]|uniref:Uncharacterized protein n=1 Tax=Galerina marginata (strain CBS 339.88) TaxID=685588 RepID=A0A067TIK3_GALM3|nr:hypothetical protein GALMADRAFT_1163021 [Galerina marginata CBS 339.88]
MLNILPHRDIPHIFVCPIHLHRGPHARGSSSCSYAWQSWSRTPASPSHSPAPSSCLSAYPSSCPAVYITTNAARSTYKTKSTSKGIVQALRGGAACSNPRTSCSCGYFSVCGGLPSARKTCYTRSIFQARIEGLVRRTIAIDIYADQLAEQHGNEVAADVLTLSRSNRCAA